MLANVLEDALQDQGVSLNEFSELALRLMNQGVLCRDASQTEAELYDRYVRIEHLLEEYLGLMGIRIVHEPRFNWLRLYPPGASVPGLEDQESAFGGGLRQRLSQDEVALVLVLRAQYDKALREGQVDENGYVADSLESLSIALKNLLGRSLPDKLTERQRLFQRLRQLRLIEFSSQDALDSGESWLRIHPMIVHFVSDDVLQGLKATPPSELNADAVEPDEGGDALEDELEALLED